MVLPESRDPIQPRSSHVHVLELRKRSFRIVERGVQGHARKRTLHGQDSALGTAALSQVVVYQDDLLGRGLNSQTLYDVTEMMDSERG